MREGLDQDIQKLDAMTANLTTEMIRLKPSEWAEQTRYLPASATPLPGFYRFNVAPYLREILDCMDPESAVRKISVKKGVQICATAGLIENSIGYFVDHIKTAPTMFVTADAELTKLRMDQFVVPMLQQSGLAHLIQANDDLNSRRTGKTDKHIEWEGGGFLVPFGAQNANKMRSIPVEILWRDEVDGWPLVVGRDGDPMKLTEARTKSYEHSRKILDISTPTIKGQSQIDKLYKRGDQRRYFVRCLHCNAAQPLAWRRENNETGEITGFVWETEGGILVPDSVRYLCRECAHPHAEVDKARLISPEHGAEWQPTATPVDATHRSYHIPGFLSKMQTWAGQVQEFLSAWDVEKNRARDVAQLQVFYNNVLGDVFEAQGRRLKFQTVSAHRRIDFNFGEIPNEFASAHCGSDVLLTICTVDVQKDHLAVAVWGWCRDRRLILISYDRWVGEVERLDDPDTWGRLRDLIDSKEYIADDGKRYTLAQTVIDSGYLADTVYSFCAEYVSGVYPVKGRSTPTKNMLTKEFSMFITPMGTTAINIMVDLYKDKISAALRRSWDGMGMQPPSMFNAPVDISDRQLKELVVETKQEIMDEKTGMRKGFLWTKPEHANNELWDLMVYANASLDVIAFDIYRNQLELDQVDWKGFFDKCEKEQLFFEPAEVVAQK